MTELGVSSWRNQYEGVEMGPFGVTTRNGFWCHFAWSRWPADILPSCGGSGARLPMVRLIMCSVKHYTSRVPAPSGKEWCFKVSVGVDCSHPEPRCIWLAILRSADDQPHLARLKRINRMLWNLTRVRDDWHLWCWSDGMVNSDITHLMQISTTWSIPIRSLHKQLFVIACTFMFQHLFNQSAFKLCLCVMSLCMYCMCLSMMCLAPALHLDFKNAASLRCFSVLWLFLHVPWFTKGELAEESSGEEKIQSGSHACSKHLCLVCMCDGRSDSWYALYVLADVCCIFYYPWTWSVELTTELSFISRVLSIWMILSQADEKWVRCLRAVIGFF